MNAMLGAIVVVTDFEIPVPYDPCASAAMPISLIVVTLLSIQADSFRKSMKKTRMRLEIPI